MIEETNLLVDRKSAIDAVRYLLMGEKYFSGIGGVSKDLVRARELFDKAASLGNKKAMSYLAKMCALGLGGNKDYNKAQELLEKLTPGQDETLSEVLLLIKGTECLANNDIQGYKVIDQQICEMKAERRKKRQLKKENQKNQENHE